MSQPNRIQRAVRRAATAAAATLALAGASMVLIGCPTTRVSAAEPRFTSFQATPGLVCLNLGDFVRVSFEVDPDTWSNLSTLCVDVLANGQAVHETLHLQCMDDGTSGEVTISLGDHFGADVPTNVTFTGRLVSSIAGTEYDTRTAGVVTEPFCDPSNIGVIGQ